MKNLSIFTIILLLFFSPGFSQSFKKATSISFNKLLVGSSISGHSTTIVFNRNGKARGAYVNKNGAQSTINGSYSFSKSKGFCWDLTAVRSDGSIANWGYKCEPLLFKGNNVVKIGNYEYKLKR